MRTKVFFISILVLLAVGIELWIRSQGIVDFPIYDTDEGIGYIPKAGQQGSYLNRVPWKVNEKNMTAGPWKPNRKPDLLLIGDSIVWGGEEYRHEEKLGPQLQKHLPGWSVWAVGASSWSVFNEVEYLKRNPEVVEATNFLLWELNSEDFAAKAQFFTDANTPRARPWSATVYATRKYLLPVDFKVWLRSMLNQIQPPPVSSFMDPRIAENRLIEGLNLFERQRVPILILVYPNRAEWLARQQVHGEPTIKFDAFLRRIQDLQFSRLRVVDGRTISPWSEQDYRDDIHPTVEGNDRLAEFLAKKVSE